MDQSRSPQSDRRYFEHIAAMKLPDDSLQSTAPSQAYTRIERVAPWTTGQFPHPRQFVPVQCQRLSPDSLLFDMDESPASKQLIVTLGQQESSVYLLAEVRSHRVAIVEGRACCRVHVDFLARLNPPPLPFDATQQRSAP